MNIQHAHRDLGQVTLFSQLRRSGHENVVLGLEFGLVYNVLDIVSVSTVSTMVCEDTFIR